LEGRKPLPITVVGAARWVEGPEREAAWTVAAMLSARPERRDKQGAPPMTHDFDIHLPDGRTVALEVTSLTVPEVVEMWDAIESLDWACPELTFNWSISLQAATRGQAGTRVRRFRAKAPPLLAILERHNGGPFGDVLGGQGPERSEEERRAIDELRRLGARSGSPVHQPASGPALLVVGTVGPGGTVDGSVVNQGVWAAARSNLAKLLATQAEERHLFVWADSTDPGALVAMASFARPAAPRLPDGIDTVWLGLWQRNVNLQSYASTLWRVTPPGAWENLHVPLVRDYAQAVVGGPAAVDR
jgi:hypothetical protein